MEDSFHQHPILSSILVIFVILSIIYYIVNNIKLFKAAKSGKDKQILDNLESETKSSGKLILVAIFVFVFFLNFDSCNRTSTKVHTDDIEFNELTGEPEYNKSFYDKFYGH